MPSRPPSRSGPTVTLEGYGGITVTVPSPEVTEADVDRQVDRLRSAAGRAPRRRASGRRRRRPHDRPQGHGGPSATTKTPSTTSPTTPTRSATHRASRPRSTSSYRHRDRADHRVRRHGRRGRRRQGDPLHDHGQQDPGEAAPRAHRRVGPGSSELDHGRRAARRPPRPPRAGPGTRLPQRHPRQGHRGPGRPGHRRRPDVMIQDEVSRAAAGLGPDAPSPGRLPRGYASATGGAENLVAMVRDSPPPASRPTSPCGRSPTSRTSRRPTTTSTRRSSGWPPSSARSPPSCAEYSNATTASRRYGWTCARPRHSSG